MMIIDCRAQGVTASDYPSSLAPCGSPNPIESLHVGTPLPSLIDRTREVSDEASSKRCPPRIRTRRRRVACC